MTEFLRDELRKAVRANHRKPLIVCGAGVSAHATNGVAPTWAKLIHSGIRRVADLDSNAAAWADESTQKLTVGDAATWISVADDITDKLGGAHNAEFATWLESEVGRLAPTRRDLLDAILTLDCPIATTNYDDILLEASGLQPIDWPDHVATLQLLEGKRQGILHLHGHWRSPPHVVLGSKSYGERSHDERHKLLQAFAALDRETVFIGCSHEGLTDPDFSRLDAFLTKWQDAAPRRYWLIRQEVKPDGTPKPLPSPDHARRLFPVSFGDKYEELVSLLQSFAPTPITPSVHVADPDATIRCIEQHEPKPEIFGRDSEVETIVSALCSPKPVIVAGGPGMGKTALATAALYDPRIVAKYGRRRIFASLETATEPRAILAKLVDALGVPPTGDEISLLRILEANAAECPIAAILDNAETALESEDVEASRVLNLAAQVKGLSLVVTVRGVPPHIPGAIAIDDLPKLTAGPARDTFLAIAGASFISDPDLVPLLEALDGHALSIRLVAAQARGSPTLGGIRESWDDAHAEILRTLGQEESRLTSVRASLALSLKSKRMKSTPLARRLISILAFLPGGLAEADVQSLLGDRGTITKVRANESVTCLHQLRLVERRLDRRLRVLTPLRECVKGQVTLIEVDRKRLIDRYCNVAAKAQKIGNKDWEKFREEVEAEIDNIDPVCELLVTTDIAYKGLDDALLGIAELHRFSGRGTIRSLQRAVERLRKRPPETLLAICIRRLGDIAVSRSDRQRARLLYDEALPIFRSKGNLVGQANCLFGLGQLAHRGADYGTARAHYEQARQLYRRRNHVLGEANCIAELGNIALALSDQTTALASYDEALELHRQLGGDVGEANCLMRIGDIALERSDYDRTRTYLAQALLLYRRNGVDVGEANCILSLGELALARGELSSARASFEQVLGLYRRLGDLIGEANCIFWLGETAFRQSDHETALAHFSEAVPLFRKIDDGPSEARTMIRRALVQRGTGNALQASADFEIGFDRYFQVADASDKSRVGWQALRQALICSDQAEVGKHLEAARSAWSAIGRLDLVHYWIDFSR